MSTRLTRQDWLDVGLEALTNDGPDGLTVEAMCTRADKTRGSYYHHFKSASDFQKQLLAWWEKIYTHDLIERVGRPGQASEKEQASEKLDHLNQLAAYLDPRIEQAFRRLAARSEDAAFTCRSVDETRIGYLARLYEQSPRYSADEAQMLARIEYAAWVGFQLIAPEAKPQEMVKMYEAFLHLTGRS